MIMDITNSTKNFNQIIDKLNDKNEGFVCIENIIDQELLSEIKSDIRNCLKEKGNPNYLSITNPLNKDLKSFKNLQTKIKLVEFLEGLTTKYLNHFLSPQEVQKVLNKDQIFSVLRYVAGSKTSLAFHYDQTLITILVPILIPKIETNKSGHLIAFPNSRKLRKYSFINFLEKTLLQNNITKKLYSLKRFKSDSIKIMKEGNIYIMNGYTTIHGNFPVDQTQERMTLLLHYGNPHLESKLLKTITFFTSLIKRYKGTDI